MYVVQVVQSGSGLLSAGYGSGRQQKPQCSRSVSSEALNSREGLSHGVIYMHPSFDNPQAAAPDALTCQPTRTAVVPWLRQIAILMRTHEQMQLPAVVTRCSAQDVGVMTAAPNSTSTTPNTSTIWGEGPDPLVIHLPGADGTAESSPADPASGGLPNTPTVVSDSSNSLALRDPSAVQRRPPPGELRFRPGSSGSRTLPSMLQRRPDALQARSAAGAPARMSDAAGANSLQPKAPNPLGFLPALQWGSNSTYWGSPIGGTLWVNPHVDSTPQATHLQQQQQQPELSKRSGMYWGSPIGGTLFINPPVEDAAGSAASAQQAATQQDKRRVHWGSPIGGTLFVNPSLDEALSAHGPAAAAAAGTASTAAATSSSSTLQGVSKKSKTSRLPFLPPFQWGVPSPSSTQWGSPIGGTMYINPQAPADGHEGPWGNSGSGFGSSSGGGGGSPASGNGSAPGAGNGSSSRGGGAGSKGSIGGVSSKQPAGGYVSARAAAQASWGAVPPGVGLAKLGVGLMAAMAAAMLAVYLKTSPAASTSSNTATSTAMGTLDVRGGATSAPLGAAAGRRSAAAGAAAAGSSGAAAADPEGVGFHQWMVQRLQGTLDSFSAEQAMLKTELAVLNSIPAANSSGKGVLGPFKRWLGSNSRNSRDASSAGGATAASGAGAVGSDLAEGAAAAAAVSGGVTARIASLSRADISARVAEIHEQLESLDVLRAALGVELAEQQQQLAKAQQEQQAAQDQLTALAGR